MANLLKNLVLDQVSAPDGTLYTVRKYIYDGRVIPGQTTDTLYGIDVMYRDSTYGTSIGVENESDLERLLYTKGDVELQSYDPMGEPKTVTLKGFGLKNPNPAPVSTPVPAPTPVDAPVEANPANVNEPI